MTHGSGRAGLRRSIRTRPFYPTLDRTKRSTFPDGVAFQAAMEEVAMRSSALRRCAAALATGWAAACTSDRPTEPSSLAPAFSVSDGAHGGNAHFFFLPPLVAAPAYAGVFDPSLNPVVTVCRLIEGACGSTIATFSTGGPKSTRIRVDEIAEQYHVNWKTTTTLAGHTYRVQVSLESGVLGYADVYVAAPRNRGLAGVHRATAGATVAIKFRIEEGASVQLPVVDVLTPGEATLHINPADGVIATIPAPDGEALQLLVVRDVNGAATRLAAVAKFAPTDGTARDVVIYSENGLPISGRTRDGAQVFFTYLDGGGLKIEVLLPTGEAAAILTTLTPPASQAAPAVLPHAARPAHRSPTPPSAVTRALGRSEEAAARAAPFKATPLSAFQSAIQTSRTAAPASSTIAAAGSTVPVTISVQAGHQGITAPVTTATVTGTWSTAALVGANPTLWSGFVATHIGAGQYVASIPALNTPGPQDAVKLACDKLQVILGSACDAAKDAGFDPQSLLAQCPQFSPVPPVQVGQALFRACEAVLLTAKYLCNLDTACTGFKKAFDAFLGSGSRLFVMADVSGPGFSQKGSGSFDPPFVPAPQVDVTLPLVVSLLIQPADPGPGEGYSAITRVFPEIAGIPVTSSIIGTDGYSDTESGTTDAAGLFFLGVPGAEAGVQDFLSTNAAGIIRTTSILF